MGERGPKGGKINRAGVQKAVRNIVERGQWYGYEVDQTASPADIVAEELIQSYAMSSYIKDEITRTFPEFAGMELTKEIITEAGATTISTEQAAWLEWSIREREHMIKTAKIAHDMGIDEKRIQLAESQAELMYRVVMGMVDAMNLTNEQRSMVPKLLPTLIRQQSLTATPEPVSLDSI